MPKVSVLKPPFPDSAERDVSWVNLRGSSEALAIAKLIDQTPGRVLIVTADANQAHRLEQEVRYFAGEDTEYHDDITLFPDWETLPYDSFSPHQDIISERLSVLARLPAAKRGALIVSVNTLMQRLAPKTFVQSQAMEFSVGQQLNSLALREQLEQAGYRPVNQVMEHGEFSSRGSILDLFPMGSSQPYRLDFFDDELDTIRPFDPETQLSQQPVSQVRLLPAHEFPLTKTGIELFRSQFRERFEITAERDSVYQQVSKSQLPGGIEYYLPLFFEHTASLFDYLPDNTVLVSHGDIQGALERLWTDINHRYEQRRYDKARPLLHPNELYLPVNEVHAGFKQLRRVRTAIPADKPAPGPHQFDTGLVSDIAANHQQKEPFAGLAKLIDQALSNNERVLLSAESAGRKETLRETVSRLGWRPLLVNSLDEFLASESEVGLLVSPIVNSFHLNADKLWFITETELLGNKIAQRRRRDQKATISPDTLIRNLAELQIDQAVVHIDHGVGRYQGLTTLDAGSVTTEFVTIEYAGGSKLYVPISSLDVLSRYSGGEDNHAPLHKLGNDSWEKAKKRAAEKVRDVAAELLDVYAHREAKSGYGFSINEDDYQRFASGFPFEETIDQQQAISALKADMQLPQPMDRLVCGDVGFGKTEVAMRGAFIAVNDGKQVMVLVPTTLLAQQHYENFKDRFADWPVRVEVLSRFKTAKQSKQILEDLASGQVDIIIGTHKLLQENVKCHDLGLLIVDEEHRFGVRQKETIKRMRADVDILTLTATPIPRTLNMAMNNIRDLSIIATPPAKRLSVKTFVREADDATVREAILREILRGGQVYFLHNNVETIDKVARDLEVLVPEARITLAHGQMRERDLERIMSDFYHQRFNVLVCTTIIETGIDVPSANTIIMNRADHLGLAQMHQLRGRVGRSHHQAYAYLLTPHPKRMTKDAAKRLEAIAQLEDLGAGFMLATHDLEIRGAGELLGDEQSGQIESIGFTLYMDMLEQAVQALKEGKQPSLEGLTRSRSEIDLRIPALLPDDYIPDVNNRLSLYKRIASSDSEQQLEDIQVELIDRFGLLPDAAKNLIRQTSLRNRAELLGIRKIDMGNQGGMIEFGNETKVKPESIIGLIQQAPKHYKLDGPSRLRISQPLEDTQTRLELIESLLTEFSQE
ncbi:transcription-repair coupling factor [Idiomarina seosinensis]|uniref:transcription-repair coupling factor n=1 Tax=Idiomarina seosinensis TaxID=281739 RepID=UPI00384C436B